MSIAQAEVNAGEALLLELWRNRLDTLITGIANNEPYYQQIANAAGHVSAEYQGRFLIELVQNANDQAVRASVKDSIVTIVRTESLIAVGNQGQPFDQERIRAITSIFLSDKTADECLGNKGIGFKAVFQVADSAEVFSAAHGSMLDEACSVAFRIVRAPFDDLDFTRAIRDLASTLCPPTSDRYRLIAERFPKSDVHDTILSEAGRAAGFTFPLKASQYHYRAQTEALGLAGSRELANLQTLIVLPLTSGTRIDAQVDHAIDELIARDDHDMGGLPATALLFLPGIGAITIVDTVRGIHARLTKQEVSRPIDIDDRASLTRLRTTLVVTDVQDGDERTTEHSQDWWVADKMLGRGAGEAADSERQSIRDAIASLRLPDANWRTVDHVPVAIALPDTGDGDDTVPSPLGPHGRFCIGLPTQVMTGLPFWVSAHFHGKIDRTNIDFHSTYNELLFQTAVHLVDVLLTYLKAAPSLSTKRLVTLSLEYDDGALASAIHASGGLADTAIMLSQAGTFVEPAWLRMPRDEDLEMFDILLKDIAAPDAYGFQLPDRLLLEHARNVIDRLAPGGVVGDTAYVARPEGLPSLIEHAATSHRGDGPTFWEPFLEWVLRHFSANACEALLTQSILPTGTSDVSSPEARVFFPPMTAVGRADGTEDDAPVHAIDDAGEELTKIDDTIAPLLKMFDGAAIQVRKGTAYTPLAQKLAPSNGGGIVRPPRQDDLLNEALIPALRESKNDREKALPLLRQALLWLAGMKAKSRLRVEKDELLVPVPGRGDSWDWVAPKDVYLGSGWGEDPNVALLTDAFTERRGSQLIPWDRFERTARRLFGSVERGWWIKRMTDIGVSDAPRILSSDRLWVGTSHSWHELTPRYASCPLPCPPSIWRKYVAAICKRGAEKKRAKEYYLDRVVWIDGLEDEAIRATVIEAMLRKPDAFDKALSVRLSRYDGDDSTDVPSLWLYTLQQEEWPIIPTNDGLRTVADAWFLPSESRTTKAGHFLSCVRSTFARAKQLLHSIGVTSIEEARVPRLIHALHALAERCATASPEDRRHMASIVTDLYEAIQQRLATSQSSAELKPLFAKPIPLERDGTIAAADIKQIEKVYVDDDPIRRRFINGLSEIYIIPKRFDETYRGLIRAFRDHVGDEAVVRISECPISLSFEAMEAPVVLLDYLRAQFPERSLAEEIAIVMVKGGTRATSPYDDAFGRAWQTVRKTSVVRGSFGSAAVVRACYDTQYRGGPALLVDSRHDRSMVIGELWQLIGASNKHIWIEFEQALRAGRADAFLASCDLSSAERLEIETVIGRGFEHRLKRYQPVCLAVWRSRNPAAAIDLFHQQWHTNAGSPQTAASWLGWPTIATDIDLSARRDEPEGSLTLLASRRITVQDWQAARRDLGELPYVFAVTTAFHDAARAALVGHIKACFAHLLVSRTPGVKPLPSKSAPAVEKWVDAVVSLAVQAEIAQAPLVRRTALSRLASDAVALASNLPGLTGVQTLIDAVRTVSTRPPADLPSLKLKGELDKAANIYEHSDAATREPQAKDAVDIILKIAVQLAATLNEPLDEKVVREHSLVVLLSTGYWANRVSVLGSLRHALDSVAPNTARRMHDRQAFRDLDDWRTLWKKFSELGEIPKPPAPVPKKQTFPILGAAWSKDDFDTSASAGIAGEIAKLVETAVNQGLDLASLRNQSRAAVALPDQTSRSKRTRGGSGGQRVSDDYLVMIGAIGELFVFSQLKIVVPDLDSKDWCSEGKEKFGYDKGNDTLGYDFDLQDAAGAITGKTNGGRCVIEVKSSASEASDSFEMSINEWAVAHECHDDASDATYVVIRVENVATRPAIKDLLVDPIRMHLDGHLNYSSRDLLVHVGRPITGEGT
jgi:hypothetical protein